MLYSTGKKWKASNNKRLSLLGMSGVGKTFIATILRETKQWFHYSVDYRIGTKYLGEEIVDNFKKEAMRSPLLREHLLNDSIYISSNITFNNLSPLSEFLGKPGKVEKGGMPFEEYLKRQRKHKLAEILATIDTELFSQKASEIYSYRNFIADTSGSLCEIVDPNDPNDPVLLSLKKSTLPVWIKGSVDQVEELHQRFIKSPKPMFYNEEFLKTTWSEYCRKERKGPEDIIPDDFMSYGFKALIKHRIPIYSRIAKNWGVTIESSDIEKLGTSEDFVEIISEAIDRKNKN